MKTFPIQDESLRSIPWDMIAPHERRALHNHGQTLQRLAERGGLSPGETILVLDDLPWDGRIFVLSADRVERDRRVAERSAELARRVAEWQAARSSNAATTLNS